MGRKWPNTYNEFQLPPLFWLSSDTSSHRTITTVWLSICMYIKKDILLSVVKHHKLFLQFGLKHSLLYFTDRSCNLQCVSSPELSSYVTQCTISCVSHQGRLHDVCHISERFGAFHFLFSSVKRTAGAGVQPFHSMHVVFLRPPPTQRTSPCCLQQTNNAPPLLHIPTNTESFTCD